MEEPSPPRRMKADPVKVGRIVGPLPEGDDQADGSRPQAGGEVPVGQTRIVQDVAQERPGDHHDRRHGQGTIQRDQERIGRLSLDHVQHLQRDEGGHQECTGKAQAKAPNQQSLTGQIVVTLPGPGDDQERAPENGRQAKAHQVVLHRAGAAGELAQELQKEIKELTHPGPLQVTGSEGLYWSVQYPSGGALAPVPARTESRPRGPAQPAMGICR